MLDRNNIYRAKLGQIFLVTYVSYLYLGTFFKIKTIREISGTYSVPQANVDSHKNMLLLKFRNDWLKIVDFLIKAYFCVSLH